MGHENHTFSNDFILLTSLFTSSQASLVFFSFIFTIFVLTVTENTVMILIIHRELRHHTPMYFLLSHLSFMDILHTSNIVPKMITDFLSGSKTISFVACGFQIFLSLTLLGGECLLLAAMSYDRYVAICHPLRYPILMNDCQRSHGWRGLVYWNNQLHSSHSLCTSLSLLWLKGH